MRVLVIGQHPALNSVVKKASIKNGDVPAFVERFEDEVVVCTINNYAESRESVSSFQAIITDNIDCVPEKLRDIAVVVNAAKTTAESLAEGIASVVKAKSKK